MLLKRVYHQDKLIRDKTGKVTDVQPNAVSHMKVVRAKKVQNFSPRIVEKGLGEGWLSMADGKISIKGETKKDSVVYKIVRTPGLYCCHCNKLVDDSGSAAVHIEASHKGVASPDSSNPAGYRKDNFYACTKE